MPPVGGARLEGDLYNLPYSVEEIYGLHASGKYRNSRKVYQEMYRIYTDVEAFPVKPEKLITEDSNAGYEFFKALSVEKNLECISAGGKSNLFENVKSENEKETCVIADGAAIGPEMNALYKWTRNHRNIKLYLPESFEWLILKSGLISGEQLSTISKESPESGISA